MTKLLLKANPKPAEPKPKKEANTGLPIGTRRRWGGVEYEKKGANDWRPVTGGTRSSSVDDAKKQMSPEEMQENFRRETAELDERIKQAEKEVMAGDKSYEIDREVLDKKKADSVREKLFETQGEPTQGMSVNITSVLKKDPALNLKARQYKLDTINHVNGVEKAMKVTKLDKKLRIDKESITSAPDAVYMKVRIKDDVNVDSIDWDGLARNISSNTGTPVSFQDAERGEKRTKKLIVSFVESRPYGSVDLANTKEYKEMIDNKTAPVAAVGLAGQKMIKLDMQKHNFMTIQGISGRGKTNGAIQIEREFMTSSTTEDLSVFIINPTGTAGKWNLFDNSPLLASKIQEGGLEKTPEASKIRDEVINNTEWFMNKAQADFEEGVKAYAKATGEDPASIGEFPELRKKIELYNQSNPDKKLKQIPHKQFVFDEVERFLQSCDKNQADRMLKLMHYWRQTARKFGARDMLITQRASGVGDMSRKATGVDLVHTSNVKMSFTAEATDGRYMFNLKPKPGQSAVSQAQSLTADRARGEFAIQIGVDEKPQTGKSPLVNLGGTDNEVSRAMNYMAALYGIKNKKKNVGDKQ